MNMVLLNLGDATAVHVNPAQVSHVAELPGGAGSEVTMATGSSFQVAEGLMLLLSTWRRLAARPRPRWYAPPGRRRSCARGGCGLC